jgi:hypothetical protein
MGVVGSAISGGKVTIAGSTQPKIYNINLTLSDTEYSQALSLDVLKLTVKLRGMANLKLAFATGESLTKFITIPAGCSYTESDLRLASSTLYFNADQASQVLEILEWT